MINHPVELGSVMTWALWALGSALLVAGAFGVVSDSLGNLGIGLATLGNLMFIQSTASRLRFRERDAFELGRESVRPIR